MRVKLQKKVSPFPRKCDFLLIFSSCKTISIHDCETIFHSSSQKTVRTKYLEMTLSTANNFFILNSHRFGVFVTVIQNILCFVCCLLIHVTAFDVILLWLLLNQFQTVQFAMPKITSFPPKSFPHQNILHPVVFFSQGLS